MSERWQSGSVGDDTPVIRSGSTPDFLLNRRLPELSSEIDDTTADLKVLLTTNPTKLAFRAVDLDSMDENTKKILLTDVYRALGIEPLRGTEH